MIRRVIATLAVLTLIGSFLAVCGGALAVHASSAYAPAPGSSADSALPIPSLPTTVAVGQRIWYGFQYAGDGSPILIDMSAAPGGSANFSVWTSDNVRNWAAGQGESPVGRGSQQARGVRPYGDDLIWSGSFRSPGVYYVVVDQTGLVPATINLKVTGSGVSAIPGPAAQAATPTAGAAQATGVPAAAVCAPIAPPETLAVGGPGSAPGQALPLPSESAYLLPAGQRAWYAFQYNGDGSQILIDLRATPDNSANFAVYTPGTLRRRWGGAASRPRLAARPTAPSKRSRSMAAT